MRRNAVVGAAVLRPVGRERRVGEEELDGLSVHSVGEGLEERDEVGRQLGHEGFGKAGGGGRALESGILVESQRKVDELIDIVVGQEVVEGSGELDVLDLEEEGEKKGGKEGRKEGRKEKRGQR